MAQTHYQDNFVQIAVEARLVSKNDESRIKQFIQDSYRALSEETLVEGLEKDQFSEIQERA